jgi:hypothetical protein
MARVVAVGQVVEVLRPDVLAMAVDRAGHRIQEALMLGQLRLQQVRRLLRLQLHLLQLLVPFPAPHLQEDDDEQRRQHQQRRAHRPAAPAPQLARLADQQPHQRRAQQDAQGVAEPPGEPVGGQVVAGQQTQQCQRAQRQGAADQRQRRRQHEETQHVAARADARAHPAVEGVHRHIGLQRGRPGGGDGGADQRTGRHSGGARQRKQGQQQCAGGDTGQQRRAAAYQRSQCDAGGKEQGSGEPGRQRKSQADVAGRRVSGRQQQVSQRQGVLS